VHDEPGARLREALVTPKRAKHLPSELLGITGGATAFPEAIPTVWRSLRGLSKLEQRGIV
jgi:hypothetical protein